MSDAIDSHPNSAQLAAFYDGRLAATESAAIQAHLAGCAVCREKHATQSLDPAASHSHTPPTALTADGPAHLPAVPEVPAALVDHPRYRVLKLLGSGGMGTVYQAEHRVMERLVALKVISRSLVDNPTAIERFNLEVRAAARLAHPNIVTAHDAEQAGDVHFLVMEFVEGSSLAQLIEQRGRLPVATACEYARQAAMGLQHAFEQGMVHRDIKPQNLMLTTKGRIKVLDFGLARFARETSKGSGLTPLGSVMGTPDYIAPEQASDPRQADIRADIYSLGCTLYFLLAGHPPFPEGTFIQKIVAHIEETPKPIGEIRPEAPAEVVAVLERMMAKDPAQRYPKPIDAARALTACFKPAALPARESPTPAEAAATRAGPLATPPLERTEASGPRSGPRARPEGSVPPPARRWRTRWGVLAALLLVAVGSVGYTAYRRAAERALLVIRSVDQDVRVLVTRDGAPVATIDTQSDPKLRLPPGDYEVALAGAPSGLTLSLKKVRLSPGGTQFVEVGSAAPAEGERGGRQ